MTVAELLEILDYLNIKDFSINSENLEEIITKLWERVKCLEAKVKSQFETFRGKETKKIENPDYKFYTIFHLREDKYGKHQLYWLDEEFNKRYWTFIEYYPLSLKTHMASGRAKRDIENILHRYYSLFLETEIEARFQVDRYGNVKKIDKEGKIII